MLRRLLRALASFRAWSLLRTVSTRPGDLVVVRLPANAFQYSASDLAIMHEMLAFRVPQGVHLLYVNHETRVELLTEPDLHRIGLGRRCHRHTCVSEGY